VSRHDKHASKAWLGLALLLLLPAFVRLLRGCSPEETPMPPVRRTLARILPPVPVMVLALAMGVVAGLLTGCGHGATACKVIDVAHEACSVVRYLGPDGKVHEVPVSQEEMAAFGLAMAAKRASEGR
jgi:hypothetical protein